MLHSPSVDPTLFSISSITSLFSWQQIQILRLFNEKIEDFKFQQSPPNSGLMSDPPDTYQLAKLVVNTRTRETECADWPKTEYTALCSSSTVG